MTKDLNQTRTDSSIAACSIQNISLNKVFKEYYRNHLLSFLEDDALCIGEVFKDDERLAYCESVDIDNARQYCRQIVDLRLHDQSKANKHSTLKSEDFMAAILLIQSQIDEPCQRLLMSHINNKNKAIEIDELKILGGLHSTTDVFLKYAELARLLCDALAYLPSSHASGKNPFLDLIISYQDADNKASSGLAIALKPVIFKALCQINKL